MDANEPVIMGDPLPFGSHAMFHDDAGCRYTMGGVTFPEWPSHAELTKWGFDLSLPFEVTVYPGSKVVRFSQNVQECAGKRRLFQTSGMLACRPGEHIGLVNPEAVIPSLECKKP